MTEFFVFLSGFAIECACVFWVHFSERHAAFRTALCSVVIGTAQVYGYTEFVLHNFGLWFVLGYGIGTWSAIRGKSWWLDHQNDRVAPQSAHARERPRERRNLSRAGT